jgi:hypothetical protein
MTWWWSTLSSPWWAPLPTLWSTVPALFDNSNTFTGTVPTNYVISLLFYYVVLHMFVAQLRRSLCELCGQNNRKNSASFLFMNCPEMFWNPWKTFPEESDIERTVCKILNLTCYLVLYYINPSGCLRVSSYATSWTLILTWLYPYLFFI